MLVVKGKVRYLIHSKSKFVLRECNSGITFLTSCVPLSGGITGVGLGVPGATPGTAVGGVPDGSVVVLPGGTGVPGKPGKG